MLFSIELIHQDAVQYYEEAEAHYRVRLMLVTGFAAEDTRVVNTGCEFETGEQARLYAEGAYMALTSARLPAVIVQRDERTGYRDTDRPLAQNLDVGAES